MKRDHQANSLRDASGKQGSPPEQEDDGRLTTLLDAAIAQLNGTIQPPRAAMVRKVLTDFIHADPVIQELARRARTAKQREISAAMTRNR